MLGAHAMQNLFIGTLLSISLISATADAGDFPKKVHYIDHEKTTAAMYKGGRVIEDAGLIVIANRAVQRGAHFAVRDR